MSNSNTNNNNMPSNPFWDFVASMQDPRNNQFAAGGPPRGAPQGEGFDPFQGSFGWGGPFGQMPHRGRRHEHGGPRGNRSPPPPEHDRDEHNGSDDAGPEGRRHGHHGHGEPRGPPHHGAHPPPPPPPAFENTDDKNMTSPEDPPSRAPTPPTPPTEHRALHGHHHSPHGRCGSGPSGMRGRPGGPGGPHGPHGHHGPGRCRSSGPHGNGGPEGRGPHSRGPHGHGPRGGPRGFGGPGHRHRGPRGPGGPGSFPFDLNSLVEAFAPGLLAGANTTRGSNDDGNFHPDLDLFDTVEAYILHLSLPGAKKSDISTTYSSTRNSVTVSGVVTRPGVNEEMMGALALDERKVGAFEREIKLEEGVKIDEDGISAKLEDGVLRVIVPKVMDEEDEEYVDVKRIELD